MSLHSLIVKAGLGSQIVVFGGKNISGCTLLSCLNIFLQISGEKLHQPYTEELALRKFLKLFDSKEHTEFQSAVDLKPTNIQMRKGFARSVKVKKVIKLVNSNMIAVKVLIKLLNYHTSIFMASNTIKGN